ncbi:hypothetical protein MAR_001454 [Mya arenaria]|uniref:Uncharacterized protein n=1 Tax=Mya arenaria TaxID=6604 RepID=A0ABY7FK72_MYAAR|nr:hypothetical protein MAR_001454 [Mya arenaria]
MCIVDSKVTKRKQEPMLVNSVTLELVHMVRNIATTDAVIMNAVNTRVPNVSSTLRSETRRQKSDEMKEQVSFVPQPLYVVLERHRFLVFASSSPRSFASELLCLRHCHLVSLSKPDNTYRIQPTQLNSALQNPPLYPNQYPLAAPAGHPAPAMTQWLQPEQSAGTHQQNWQPQPEDVNHQWQQQPVDTKQQWQRQHADTNQQWHFYTGRPSAAKGSEIALHATTLISLYESLLYNSITQRLYYSTTPLLYNSIIQRHHYSTTALLNDTTTLRLHYSTTPLFYDCINQIHNNIPTAFLRDITALRLHYSTIALLNDSTTADSTTPRSHHFISPLPFDSTTQRHHYFTTPRLYGSTPQRQYYFTTSLLYASITQRHHYFMTSLLYDSITQRYRYSKTPLFYDSITQRHYYLMTPLLYDDTILRFHYSTTSLLNDTTTVRFCLL